MTPDTPRLSPPSETRDGIPPAEGTGNTPEASCVAPGGAEDAAEDAATDRAVAIGSRTTDQS